MPKILDAQAAVGLAVRKFEKLNYMQMSRSGSSRYFGKRGSPYRIRVSDHEDQFKNDDVLVDMIFNYETIENDVDVRISRAVSEFERKVHMRWLNGVKG